MSTTIYKGFSVATDSAVAIMERVDQFRPYVQQEGQKIFKAFLRKTGTANDPLKGWKAWMDMRAETVDQGFRAPELDTQFQLVFFPDQNRFLGVAFTEHERWFRHWLRQPLVQEYRYWNNANHPGGLSQKAWDRRAQDWDRVLGMDAPSTRGFTITLHEIGGPSRPSYQKAKRKAQLNR